MDISYQYGIRLCDLTRTFNFEVFAIIMLNFMNASKIAFKSYYRRA